MSCFDKEGHKHKMEKLGFGLDDDSGTCDQKQTNPQESRMLSTQRCSHCLVHGYHYRDANCTCKDATNCQMMNIVVEHYISCKRKSKGGCLICKKLIALCFNHAKHCQVLILFVALIVHIHAAPQQRGGNRGSGGSNRMGSDGGSNRMGSDGGRNRMGSGGGSSRMGSSGGSNRMGSDGGSNRMGSGGGRGRNGENVNGRFSSVANEKGYNQEETGIQ